NCSSSGTTTINSATGAVSGDTCGGSGTLDASHNVAQSASGGPSVFVVRLRGLVVTNNHVLKLTGDKPVIFLVSGNVLVDSGGAIDAGATGTTAGPGGSIAGNCGGSTGANGTSGTMGAGG